MAKHGMSELRKFKWSRDIVPISRHAPYLIIRYIANYPRTKRYAMHMMVYGTTTNILKYRVWGQGLTLQIGERHRIEAKVAKITDVEEVDLKRQRHDSSAT